MKKPIMSRDDAIRILMGSTEHEDPHWENLVQDWYDEDTDTIPSVWDVFRAAGFNDPEIEKAAGLRPGRLQELGL